MRIRTKKTIVLSLLGSALALGLTGLSFLRSGSFADEGASALATPFMLAAVFLFLSFNWFIVHTLTGIRLLGFLSNDEKSRADVRQFSWLLIMLSPILLVAPVWIVATKGAYMNLIVSAAIFIGAVVFSMFMPASDDTMAVKRFMKEYSKTSKN